MGWAIECWDVSMAFLCARLFGDMETDLGGNEIFVRPPKILVKTEVVSHRVLFGRSRKFCMDFEPHLLLWETERDNTLKAPKWQHNKMEYRLLPCLGSPCLWICCPFSTR